MVFFFMHLQTCGPLFKEIMTDRSTDWNEGSWVRYTCSNTRTDFCFEIDCYRSLWKKTKSVFSPELEILFIYSLIMGKCRRRIRQRTGFCLIRIINKLFHTSLGSSVRRTYGSYFNPTFFFIAVMKWIIDLITLHFGTQLSTCFWSWTIQKFSGK